MSKSAIGYIVIIVMLVCAGYFALSRYFLQREDHDIVDIHAFPQQIGEWRGEDIELTEKEYDILETRNLIMRKYTNAADRRVLYLFIIYSQGTCYRHSSRGVIHIMLTGHT